MAKSNSSEAVGAVPTYIPSYIIDRDALASAAGLDVDRRIIEGKIYVTWSGTESQFRSTGLFTKLFKFRNNSNLHHRYIRWGNLCIHDAGLITLTWREDIPQSVTRHEATNIDVLRYDKDAYELFIKYYGTPIELIEAGIVSSQMLPLGAKGNGGVFRKTGYCDADTKKHCDALLLPNGKAVVDIYRLLDPDSPLDFKVEKTGDGIIQREEYVADLRNFFDTFMQTMVRYTAGIRGWRFPESDYQKIVELKAHGEAIIANARPLPIGAPVLRLVK